MLPPNLHLTYNDAIFLFQSDQFDTLRQATIAASFVAMISSFLVLVTFVYILVVDPKKANRISIRCVVIACTADGIDALFNILMSKLPGPQAFCRAAGIVANVMRLISASFLAIVGFNLVLIFVINVKRRDLLEYYYYPGAVLYVTVSAVVSIYFASTAPPVDAPFETCWYMNFILERSNITFSWMWYYGSLFFINFLAMVSSVAALLKLVSEQRSLRQHVDPNSYMGQVATNHADTRFQRKQNAILSKVVVRCIIYPLIPLLMNIWGFVIQLLITVHQQQPSFALSMVDTIFACLEGFFVALVYFTDPAFTAFVHDRLSFWRSKYVDEYRLVELRAMDPKDGSQAHPKSRTLFIMPMEKPSNVPVWDSAIIHSDPKSRDSHLQESIHRECRPMRRIRIPPSTLAQLAVNYNIRQLSYCTLPSVTEEHLPQQPQSPHHTHHHPPQQHPQDSIAATSISSTTQLTTPPEDMDDAEGNVVHEVFVPYRVAWWARMCHWLFSGYAMKYLCTSSTGTSSGPISSSTIELRSYSAHQPSPDAFDRDLLEDHTLAAKRRLQTALSETTRHY